jgi:hypothetical protein
VTCGHERSVTSNVSKHGVLAEITVCATCGEALDYRPLREKDLAGSEAEMPAYESEIQARAKAAKAEEIALASPTGKAPDDLHVAVAAAKVVPCDVEALTESGLVTPARVPLSVASGEVVLCQKHGGTIVPCDVGARRANQCHHSKWGSLRTFNSPCACLECHDAK